MNKIFSIISACLLLFTLASCEQDLPNYSDSQARLNFDNSQYKSGLVNYSFTFNDKQQDTVWIQLNTMGYLSDQDRPFELQQITTGRYDAIPGQHYVAFDDAAVKPYLVIPAGKNYARVPVILKRDATLDTAKFNLNIALKPDANFQIGYVAQSSMTVTMTSQLTQPTEWAGAMNYYFGTWGPVKHRFMIQVTGKKWDNEYILSIENDFSMVNYLINQLDKALAEENAKRAAAGQPYLQEADGTLVAFGW